MALRYFQEERRNHLKKPKHKFINKARYDVARQKEIHKKSNYADYVPKKYKGMAYMDRIKAHALEASDNGRCWWIYNYVLNAYGRK